MRLSLISTVILPTAVAVTLTGCTASQQTAQNVPSAPTLTLHQAVTEKVYSFGATGDGFYPRAALLDVGGILYGTTSSGGSGHYGTVFELTPAPLKETVLYNFTYTPSGTFPEAKLINVNGTLYGTTYEGGVNRVGTVFSITPSGQLIILHNFTTYNGDGHGPEAGLTNVNGVLYGTTQFGGSYGYGTVFSITTGGTETVLHSFGSGSDGIYPVAELININGILYGTTYEGGGTYCGGGPCGTVFSMTTSGKETVLHSFTGPPDGAAPDAGLTNVNGTLYGTTYEGGSQSCGNIVGCGIVFSIDASNGERVLYSFGGAPDGEEPMAGLLNAKGNLYGTTYGGGAYSLGTVFSITTTGQEAVLYSFKGRDGAHPAAALISENGNLVGTTVNGGSNTKCVTHSGGCGTVFSITP